MTERDVSRNSLKAWRIDELLGKYSGLRLMPTRAEGLKLAGPITFSAHPRGLEAITDEYFVQITVPPAFPRAVPAVRETVGRIPASYHTLADGSLCLGSPMRLRLIVSESPSLIRFVDRCLIPYLYGHSYHEKYGVMPFGELAHGDGGIRQDIASIFGVDERCDLGDFLRLAGMRRREANKRPCPCGSGSRLGRCHNRRVNTLRGRLGRQWFRRCLALLRSPAPNRLGAQPRASRRRRMALHV
jgi:hypothetical protein